MSPQSAYLSSRFHEVEAALANTERWSTHDPELGAYLAGYLVVLVCGVFEDCVEHLVLQRADRTGDRELAAFVKSSIERLRNPKDSEIAGLLKKFSEEYKRVYRERVPAIASTALDSIVDNKNFLAHGDTSKMNVTVSDVRAYFARATLVFEVLETLLDTGLSNSRA